MKENSHYSTTKWNSTHKVCFVHIGFYSSYKYDLSDAERDAEVDMDVVAYDDEWSFSSTTVWR